MSIYAISDLHLSFDERIEKPMDIFGDGWVDHAENIREHWLAKIRPTDTVLLPGDLSWGLRLDEAMADLRWIHELPGTKIITKGNHDLWWMGITKLNQLFDEMVFRQNHCYVVEEADVAVCGTRGWICPGTEGFDDHDQKIYDRELIRLEFSLQEAKASGAGEIIAALHYPPTNDKLQPSGFTQMLEDYGVSKCIYGHLHGKHRFRCGLQGVMNGISYRLVSQDYLQGDPILLK